MASYCDGKAKYILEVVCSHQQRFGENVNVGVASNPTKEKKEDQEELETKDIWQETGTRIRSQEMSSWGGVSVSAMLSYLKKTKRLDKKGKNDQAITMSMTCDKARIGVTFVV